MEITASFNPACDPIMSTFSELLNITFDEDDKGSRLDKALVRHASQFSRSRVQALIEAGNVTRNGKTITDPAVKVKPGEMVEIVIPPVTPAIPAPRAMALDIVYEDTHLLVINKPAGLTVHPAPGHYDDTLVNALLAHCGESLSGIGGMARPGIVHRLDKDTSGLMVVAKHDKAHQALAKQLVERTMKRTYLALVYGVPNPTPGKIEGNIGRSSRNRQKMAVLMRGGKNALTHYEVKERLVNRSVSLVECVLQTGRTHQIRVHMAHAGHPLVGDALYGGGAARARKALTKEDKSLRTALETFPRQALHAVKLSFSHPENRKMLQFEVALPVDFSEILDMLRSART